MPVAPPGALVPPVLGPAAVPELAAAGDEPPEELGAAPEETGGLADALAAGVELVEVVEGVLVVVVDGTAVAAPVVGTVNGGAPVVLAEVVEPPPPQAASAVLTTSKARVAIERLISAGRALGAERLHAPAAVRAVVEILLCELVTPVAET